MNIEHTKLATIEQISFNNKPKLHKINRHFVSTQRKGVDHQVTRTIEKGAQRNSSSI